VIVRLPAPRIARRGLAGVFAFLAAGLLAACFPQARGRDADASGIPRTQVPQMPPMGWNSWNAFGCDIDANRIIAAADALVSTGLRDAGYVYVNIDDCWQYPQRDAQGRLQADPERFPGGIRALAAYVHARGLKLGLYASPGSRSCGNIWDNYPGKLGSLGHEELDARTFAEWGIDYLKYDWCRADEDGLRGEAAFTKMGDALRATGRQIFFSIHHEPQLPVEPWRPRVANAWRTTADIRPEWAKLMAILDQQVGLEEFSSPGHWNDPDMLEVGNGALTLEESRAHFSLWSLLNAPLLLGNDLSGMGADVLGIVANCEVVAVNQDWAGIQGHKLRDDGGLEVWGKPLSGGAFAVVLLNRTAMPAAIVVSAQEMGLDGARGLRVRDLWKGAESREPGWIRAEVPPHAAAMYRVVPADGGRERLRTPRCDLAAARP